MTIRELGVLIKIRLSKAWKTILDCEIQDIFDFLIKITIFILLLPILFFKFIFNVIKKIINLVFKLLLFAIVTYARLWLVILLSSFGLIYFYPHKYAGVAGIMLLFLFIAKVVDSTIKHRLAK